MGLSGAIDRGSPGHSPRVSDLFLGAVRTQYGTWLDPFPWFQSSVPMSASLVLTGP